MSPDPNQIKVCEKNNPTCSEAKTVGTNFDSAKCQLIAGQVQYSMEINNTTVSQKCNDSLIKTPLVSTGRGKRNVSPSSFILNDAFVDPQSPSSSSSTSQATSANDATFEPTIEMMVNDFDDEQTLNEEEALASLESQDPDDEINTLKKESEMPLEELLAKYRALPPLPTAMIYSEPIRKKKKSSHKENQKQKHRQEFHNAQKSTKNTEENSHTKINEYFEEEMCHGNNLLDNEEADNFEGQSSSKILTPRKNFTSSIDDERKDADDNSVAENETVKVCRSHLLDLYPEGTFDSVVAVDEIGSNSKETLYDVEDDEEIEEEEDEDYKKKVMIGTSYQATIPIGLSQYGDILPYENEDKLIWEPCQVSEREVEEYLIKIRDIKSNQQGEDDEDSAIEINSEAQENGRCEKNVDNLENNSFLANGDTLLVETAASVEFDHQTIVKDNEQALHLLVQCGYDFKEALRRKRLNALPLNDCMSLWSEEECHKFEEGIQKYGKDFLKIRQNQVRTRTMRELVQFYYLWKKSERRDQNFANADTVDHMDIYLNEENEYGSNPTAALTPLNSPVGNTPNCTGVGRNSNTSLKNISIMTTTSITPVVTNLPAEKNGTKTGFQQHHHHQPQNHKRRIHSCSQPNLNVAPSDFNSENSSNTFTSSAK